MSVTLKLNELFGETPSGGGWNGGASAISFGADFGTSTCQMAYKEGPNGLPKIPQKLKSGLPSLFMLGTDGKEYACDEVIRERGLEKNPAGVCTSVKMKLEEDVIVLNGKSYKPRYIAVSVAKRFLKLCREALTEEWIYDEIRYLVVGVPVRFSARVRGELKFILQEAVGENVTVYIVPEPILAALANNFYKGKQAARTGSAVVLGDTLVVDAGGGTTDIVLLRPNAKRTGRNPHPFTAHAPEGIPRAGDEMDRLLYLLMVEKITASPGTIPKKYLPCFKDESHFLCRRLRQIAKTFKEQLSSRDSYDDTLAFGDAYGMTTVSVTRAEYEDRIRPLIQEIVELSATVLERAGMGPKPDVDILLVGGASYTPLLRTMLEQRFPWLKFRIDQRFPESAVAMGAAIYAEDPALVAPKVAYGYGVNTYTKDGSREVIHVVIPSDAELPMTDLATFDTKENGQLAVTFRVYEVENTNGRVFVELSEGDPKSYSITHKFGRRVPKETPVQLKTTLSEEGLLTLTVSDDLYDGPEPTTKQFSLSGTTMA